MKHLTRATAAGAVLLMLGGCAAHATTSPGAQAPERPDRPQVVAPVVHLDRKPAPPPIAVPGDSGPVVRELQARLRQIEWYFGDVTGEYGATTTEAVRGFQEKRGVKVTGTVDRRTLSLVEGMTTEPTDDELRNVKPDPADGRPLDPRCLTGHVLCVDKTSSSLRWVVDGEVQLTLDARFGGNGYFTREGEFQVYLKSRDHVSRLYGSSMPYAMFFSGGQAVHYSPDFAATGYSGASHGCVNIRDYDEVAWLFDQVSVGDKVIVYWA